MFQGLPELYVGVENRPQHIVKLLYSAAYFSLAWIIVAYSGHAWSASNASQLGYSALFSYDGIENLTGTRGWNVSRIGWVYLAPPIWGLLVSIISIALFNAIDGTRTHLKTLLFWLTVNGYMFYLSYVVSGIVSGQVYSSKLFTGFVGFYSWLDWGKGKIYGLLIIQLIVSLAYPLLFSKPVLQLNYSRYVAARKGGKVIIFLNIVAIPAMAGFALLIAATFPLDITMQFIRLFCFIPVFIVMFLGLGMYKANYISVVKGGLRPTPLTGMVLLFGLILLLRLGLGIMVKPFW